MHHIVDAEAPIHPRGVEPGPVRGEEHLGDGSTVLLVLLGEGGGAFYEEGTLPSMS